MTAVGHAAIIIAERKALLARTESLVREFHPALPAGTGRGTGARSAHDVVLLSIDDGAV